MANQKVSELSGAVVAPSGADFLLIENASAHKKMTFANLIADLGGRYHPLISSPNTAFNKNFGTSAGTVSEGDHNHSGVYEPADAAIVKSDEAETITSEWIFNDKVGIGVTPVSKLQVKQVSDTTDGGFRVDNSTNSRNIKIWNSATVSYIRAIGGSLVLKTDFGDVLTITASGTSTFVSTVTATNFIDSSDKRLKKDVDPLCNCYLKKFDKIKPIQYRLKDGNDALQFGVIAQDIEKLYPNIVTIKEDGFKGVNYRSLAMITLAKVQVQQKEIDSLREALNRLEKKIK